MGEQQNPSFHQQGRGEQSRTEVPQRQREGLVVGRDAVEEKRSLGFLSLPHLSQYMIYV